MKTKYIAGICLILTFLFAIFIISIESRDEAFEEISNNKLDMLLTERIDSIIFCSQETCSGCKVVEDDLKALSSKYDLTIYKFEVNTQSDKDLLYEYGLTQVPALVIISEGQVNVYKGNLSKENIEKAVFTTDIKYLRFDSIEEISYEHFQNTKNINTDFFVYFGSNLCSDCRNFTSVLEQFIEDIPDAGMYYIDLDKIKANASNKEYEHMMEEYKIRWVPYVLHIKNGVILSYYEYPKPEYRGELNTDQLSSNAAKDFVLWFKNELK